MDIRYNINKLDTNLKDCFDSVNIESPLHWGQKYEPISVEFYKKVLNTSPQR